MKTSAWDFVLAGLCLAAVGAGAFAITAALAYPFSSRSLGAYHVIADALIFLLLYGVLSALFVRMLLVIWPLRPGDYSMDHPHFAYWKLFTVIHELGRCALLPFTTVFAKPLVAALFGAKMGRNVAFGGHMNEPPLVSVGDNAILGQDCVITAHAIMSGRIILREVSIGRSATIGVNTVVMPGVEIGDGAVVAASSVVSLGTKIPPGEMWGGIPARKIKDLAQTDIRG
jgi:acetyltransferase-like isoleucine patch superfamily enzyme